MKQIILSFLIGAVTIPAAAQDHRPTRAEMEARIQQVKVACKDDKATFCSDVEGREAMECLIENKNNLEKTCADLLPKGPRPEHGGHRPPPPPAERNAAE